MPKIWITNIYNILDQALLLFLWSCLVQFGREHLKEVSPVLSPPLNHSIWVKQKCDMTIQFKLDKLFLLWGSLLRSLSTCTFSSYDASKEVKN